MIVSICERHNQLNIRVWSCSLWFRCHGMVFLSLMGVLSEHAVPDGMPELYPVVVSVVQDGKPLEGASVQLIPADAINARWACGGCTNANGEAEIATLGGIRALHRTV